MDAYHSSYTRKLELTTTNYAVGAVSVYYHHASQPYIEDAARIPADGSHGLAGAHQHIGRIVSLHKGSSNCISSAFCDDQRWYSSRTGNELSLNPNSGAISQPKDLNAHPSVVQSNEANPEETLENIFLDFTAMEHAFPREFAELRSRIRKAQSQIDELQAEWKVRLIELDKWQTKIDGLLVEVDSQRARLDEESAKLERARVAVAEEHARLENGRCQLAADRVLQKEELVRQALSHRAESLRDQEAQTDQTEVQVPHPGAGYRGDRVSVREQNEQGAQDKREEQTPQSAACKGADALHMPTGGSHRSSFPPDSDFGPWAFFPMFEDGPAASPNDSLWPGVRAPPEPQIMYSTGPKNVLYSTQAEDHTSHDRSYSLSTMHYTLRHASASPNNHQRFADLYPIGFRNMPPPTIPPEPQIIYETAPRS
ncbi:hypothetical protein IEO21_08697 [Rhodonia placenta]|uniref:Uncharacterized protein n=1 Tax=Rhodonia placenta TaxID=104341 RepID=A0A8H7NW58_9APHY|nr:hypothetical protein IEO21_08697 [Postia placenta]